MTIRTAVTAAAILFAGLALGACSFSSSTSTPSTPGTTSNLPGSQTPQLTPAPTAKIESSGNVETDLQTMDKELNGLDATTDFPSFTQQDLEK